jgi:hypothetical protein
MGFFFSKSKNTEVKLTDKEETLLKKLLFSKELVLAIRSNTRNHVEELFELQMFYEYEHEPGLKGIKSLFRNSITIPAMYTIVRRLQANISFKDYHIFSGGHYGGDKDYFIGAIKTTDQYECLRVFETNGINYNIKTKDIIRFFSKWQKEINFSIIDAYHDRVVIQLAHLNFDIDLFAKEALELCPDFLSAVEDEKQLKKYIIDRKHEMDFWWD